VFTYDQTTEKLYVNGNLVDSAACNHTLTYGASVINVGTNVGTNGTSAFDDVRIYNRALGPGEIQQLYNMGR
jgi:hypothetical protein